MKAVPGAKFGGLSNNEALIAEAALIFPIDP